MLGAHRTTHSASSHSARAAAAVDYTASSPFSSSSASQADRRLYSVMQQIRAPGAFARPAPIRAVDTAGGASSGAGVAAAAAAPSVAASTVAASSASSPLSPASATSSGGAEDDASLALSSRQIPLFQQGNTQLRKAEPTNIVIDEVTVHNIPRIQDYLPTCPAYTNRFARTKASIQGMGCSQQRSTQPASAALLRGGSHSHLSPGASAISDAVDDEDVGYKQLIKEGDVVLLDIVRRSGLAGKPAFGGAKSFVRAGPREHICWAPGEAVAAIVTCGGLCPGLNDVIAELFNTLYFNYGINRIYGIRSGFRGFWDPKFWPYIELTPEGIRGIDAIGGTVLGSSRGGFNLDAIMQACMNRGINQLYIIGGDGTHRAADLIQHEARRRRIKMTVACVPKTIDNDIGVIDRSFGFNTAVGEARKAIQSAVVEASCAPNGLGIVQLMGRHAGYIAAHATLASRQVDLVLIPEVPFPMDGPCGILALTEGILARQGYGVIVVAEGAGVDLLPTIGVDESGNKKLPEIGKFLQSAIQAHFARKKQDVSIKYHDPSYMIRSVPADAADAVYCMTLAQNAVHGAMCGFTGFTSGLVNNRTVLLPIPVITATSPSYLNPDGRTWERVVSLTHQPTTTWERMAENKKREKELAIAATAAAAAAAPSAPAPAH